MEDRTFAPSDLNVIHI